MVDDDTQTGLPKCGGNEQGPYEMKAPLDLANRGTMFEMVLVRDERRKGRKNKKSRCSNLLLCTVLWCCSSGPSELDTNSREGS